jgi:hypothetical protein
MQHAPSSAARTGRRPRVAMLLLQRCRGVTLLTEADLLSGVNMHVAHDVARALDPGRRPGEQPRQRRGGAARPRALRAFLDEHEVSGASGCLPRTSRRSTRCGRACAQSGRPRHAPGRGGRERLVAESGALPQLTDHDGHDWHLHWTSTSARRRLPARRGRRDGPRGGAARRRAPPGCGRARRRSATPSSSTCPATGRAATATRQLRQPGARGGVPGAAALRRRRRELPPRDA